MSFDEIILSRKERKLLRRIMKKKRILYDSCNENQREILLQYDLIDIEYGSPGPFSDPADYYSSRGKMYKRHPKYIIATDEATRYFRYRREDYFKHKLLVYLGIITFVLTFWEKIFTLFCLIIYLIIEFWDAIPSLLS